jgi:hypothetical protein
MTISKVGSISMGSGTINEQPFELRIAGGPLLNLDPEHPYPYNYTSSLAT